MFRRAFDEGERVVIGLTSDAFVKKFKSQSHVAPYITRKEKLDEWLIEQNLTSRSTVIPIDDPYEPAASENWDGIIVSSETKPRGIIINEIRKKRGKNELALIEVALERAEDGGTVSSTRIRLGEIDLQGKLVMPEELRGVLAKPLGVILRGIDIRKSFLEHKKGIVATVGDVTTASYLETGSLPSLAIVDLKVGRQRIKSIDDYEFGHGIVLQHIQSGPGYISGPALEAIHAWSKQGGAVVKNIIIDGEEDLLVLPAVLYAPIGTIVYYGQPNQGVVEVLVSRDKKKQVEELLNQFTN